MKTLIIGLTTFLSTFAYADSGVALCSLKHLNGKKLIQVKITSEKPVSLGVDLNGIKYIIGSGRFIDNTLDIWIKKEIPYNQVGIYQQEITNSLHTELLQGQEITDENKDEKLTLSCRVQNSP